MKMEEFKDFMISEEGKEVLKEIVSKGSEVTFNKQSTMDIHKIDKPKQQIFGFFSVIEKDGEIIFDLEGDAISEETIEKAVYDYVLNARIAGERHIKKGVGDLIESIVFTKEKQELLGIDLKKIGWWGGFHITDDEVWKKVEKGEYPMFSIGGKGHRTEIEE